MISSALRRAPTTVDATVGRVKPLPRRASRSDTRSGGGPREVNSPVPSHSRIVLRGGMAKAI
jgi:hypothetical protein